jgi:hypothetical protein
MFADLAHWFHAALKRILALPGQAAFGLEPVWLTPQQV